MRWIILGVVVMATPATARSLFTVGQRIEVKVGANWRPCVVTDPGAKYRVARAKCPAFPTPTYTYPAGEEVFAPQGTSDVRFPGSNATTSPYAGQRPSAGATGRAVPMFLPAAVAIRPAAFTTPAALQRCIVGRRVQTPGGLAARVIRARGALCTIQTDVPSYVDGTFAASMLRPLASSSRKQTATYAPPIRADLGPVHAAR
ncbi:hypothetical protein [Sphingomonas sp.]|jgi:hypothetical protein|uniref:hypothetical protein n=1 Tax=Sphingomonas sp. TaxID=28214 RepID=UPI002D8034E5|nr:hypothetical protein [Sphingomonas sp.]HEU0043015.1 hypothetical protein [Sphingomonas sp.]